jgi:hypothetical protein
MKKFFLLFVAVLALVSLVAISCSQGGLEPPAELMSGEPSPSVAQALLTTEGTTMLYRELPTTVYGTVQPQTMALQPSLSPQTSPTECAGTPMFTHFKATPSTITWEQSTLLEWGPVTNGETGTLVDSVVLTPGNFGEVGSPGSIRVYPKTTTTYTLTASGCGGAASKSVTVVVPFYGAPAPIYPQSPPEDGDWSGQPKVTSVIAKAVPSSYTGPGPTTANFIADITVDGPCRVTYNWERSDGARSTIETLFFSTAGTKQIGHTWAVIQGPGGNVNVLWERVNIITPIPTLSNKAEFTLNITP